MIKIVAFALALVAAGPAIAAPAGVLVHINTPDVSHMKAALVNVKNLANYYSEKGQYVPIEIVVNGPAISMMLEDRNPVRDRVIELQQTIPGLELVLCGNTLDRANAGGASNMELLDGVIVVQAGVGYLADKQGEGWAYLKP